MKKLLSTLTLCLLLVACGGDTAPAPEQKPETTTTPQTANLTKVRVVTSAYAPFVTKDEQGQITGFDVDILKAIAKLEGLELELTQQPWSEALSTLTSDKSDIVISAVTPTNERLEKYLASKPYVNTPNSLAVLENSSIKSIDDLKGKVVGLEKGSSFLSEKSKYPETTFKEFDTSYLALKDATTNKVDAVVAHRLHLQHLINSQGLRMRFVDLPTSHPNKVIMLKKGNNELVQKINRGLDTIQNDGTYDKIHQKWFGTAPITQ